MGPEWDWTIPEPQDRIDFIFYKQSPSFRPIRSVTYAGKGPLKPIPDQWDNEWPSDHYSVITDFIIDIKSSGSLSERSKMNLGETIAAQIESNGMVGIESSMEN